jgi:hypothetical protein
MALDRRIQHLLGAHDSVASGQNLVDLDKAKKLRAAKTDKI